MMAQLNAVAKAERPTSSEKVDSGMASIKSEFINLNYKPRLVTTYLPKDTVEEIQQLISLREKAKGEDQDVLGPGAKKAKLKGRNKKRPMEKHPLASEKLCPNIVGQRCCIYGDQCKFSHDLAEFMKTKPNVIEGKCYVFETYGHCPFGITCLFSKQHTTDNMLSITNHEIYDHFKDKQQRVKNIISKDLQIKLRKKEYNFRQANKVIKLLQGKGRGKNQKIRDSGRPTVTGADEDLKSQLDLEVDECAIAEGSIEISCEHIEQRCTELSGCHFDHPAHKDNTAACCSNVENRGGERETACCNDLAQDREVVESKGEGETACSDLSHGHEVARLTSSSLSVEKSVTSGQLESNFCPNQKELSEIAEGQTLTGHNDTDKGKLFESKAHCMENTEECHIVKPVVQENSGCNEDVICLNSREKKKINFKDKLYLAPLTTVGNLPFRRICKTFGADVTCGEMAMTSNLLQGQASEWALLKRHESETLFGAQLCGSYPDSMTRTAQVIVDTMDVDFIDINIGCPIDMVVQKGEGCAVMGRIGRLEQIVHGMSSIMDIPLTVKMRTGLQEDKHVAHSLLPQLRDWGVSMVTVHGRSREQRYTKLADWKYIKTCVDIAKPLDVFGNGDILSYTDFNEAINMSGAAGCMIARGALVKPWLFTEIKEQRHWDISASERLEIIRTYVNYGLEHWGSDQKGVANTRRFLLEWLSFFHRYIPVGILERVPQRINEKPPHYFGRNDLETLMASSNCADWIKISEMFLGPVPDGFTFLPKHRANAYQ